MMYLLIPLLLLIPPPLFSAPSTPPTEQIMDIPGAVYFTPPEGWHLAESEKLPPNVKVMVVGKGNHTFAPSINLTEENYKGTLKQYLKIVKAINDSKGATWQDLGTIRTQAGNASLSQVDTKTEWGESRMMHVILQKNGKVYILTAAALKEEFPRFYKEFFTALRSLHMNKTVYEMISNPKKRANLDKKVSDLKNNWKMIAATHPEMSGEQVFNAPLFQENYWRPFQNSVSEEFKDMSPNWKESLFSQVQEELTASFVQPQKADVVDIQ